MSKEKETLRKIYDYLNGTMDELAVVRFEQELKNNPVLNEKFRIMEGVKEMLERREQRLRVLELINMQGRTIIRKSKSSNTEDG